MCPLWQLLLQDEVLIAGFGRRGHAVGDIPGVRFKVSVPQATSHLSLAEDFAVCRCSCADPGSSSMHAQVMKGIADEMALSLRVLPWAGGQGGGGVSVGALPGKEREAQELINPPRPTLCNAIKTVCGANILRYCFFSTAVWGTGSASEAMYNMHAHGCEDSLKAQSEGVCNCHLYRRWHLCHPASMV